MNRHEQIMQHYENLYGGVDVVRPKSWIVNVNKMKRKSCYQSKKDNPNWMEKVILPELNRIELNLTECFLDDNQKVMKFSDKQIFGDGKTLGYSCEGLIK